MPSSDWMTRREAAEYLRISVSQLNRLRLPRAVVGARPRYSLATLDQYLQLHTTTPQRKKGGPSRPPLPLSPARKPPTDVASLLKSWR